jgi:putative ABC transport system permease protein
MKPREIWHRLFRLERPRGRIAEHVDEEFRFHIDGRAELLRQQGLSEEDARAEAIRRFGDMRGLRRRTVKASTRRVKKESRMEYFRSISGDIRFGFRALSRNRVLSAVAVLTLALGIGMNVAFFGVVKGVVLEPLSYRDPDRLLMLWESEPELERAPLTGPDYLDWREQSTSFSEMGVFTTRLYNLLIEGEAEQVLATPATAGFWAALEVEPLLGRLYSEQEEQEETAVVMISHSLWMRGYGGDESVIGKSMVVNGQAHAIIAVMPEHFYFPMPWRTSARPDVWTPLKISPENPGRDSHWIMGVGRLKDGVNAGTAEAELQTIAAALAEAYPATNTDIGARVVPIKEQLLGGVGGDYMLLLGAVGLVLLIACANIASLLMARAASRRSELAVRSALGANRGRLARQMLTESCVVAGIGGVIGLLVALLGLQILQAVIPATVPRAEHIGVDPWLLAFTIGVTLLTAIVSGFMPSLTASRSDLSRWLREGRRGASGSRSSNRFRDVLVVLQFAVALLLANAGALMVQSYLNARHNELGVNTQNVITAGITLVGERYESSESIITFWDQLLEAMSAYPGVLSASFTSKLPLEGGNNGTVIVEGQPFSDVQWEGPLIENSSVRPDYFETMGIGLLAGRTLNDADATWPETPGAVINEMMAHQLWPGESALGKRFSYARTEPIWISVVGIVENVRQFSMEREPFPEIYLHHDLSTRPGGFLVMRTGMDPMGLAGAIRSEVARVDPTIPASDIRTMEQVVGEDLSQRRFNTFLIGLFASMALVLVTGGIYGVMAYFVAQRNREIGVRMALGAGRSEVRSYVVGRGLRLAAVGIMIGVLATVVTTGVVERMLFGVGPLDPALGLIGIVLLMALAVVASGVPAFRATRIDPMRVLSTE